ncbi:MAG: DNA repair protein RecN [Thiotrichales bacterium]|nr:DNA repair protein RecN [Thiotrichales bacterium]
MIECLDLEFGPGMTVFTGETGAGKSIIVDAMGLILGDRGDSSVVRKDQAQTEISAVFDITENAPAQLILTGLDIEFDHGEIILRRVIHEEGRSRGFINGTPVPIQQLKTLGECLVELHGQHSHQSMLKPNVQRDLLDSFGDYHSDLDEVSTLFRQWNEIQEHLQLLSGEDEDHIARISLLEYQANELTELDLGKNEFTEVDARFRQLSQLNRIIETIESASTELCDGEASALNACSSHLAALSQLREHDPKLGPVVELLNNAVIHLEETAAELRNYLGNLDTDPESLARTGQRLDSILEIARKHRVQPEELHAHARQLYRELELLKDSAGQRRELQQQNEQALQAYREAADRLNRCRNKAAKKMAAAISEQLQQLGMPAAKFEINIEHDAGGTPADRGLDRIEFRFSANPGQAPKPMSRVASGGELSRISLAVQVISMNPQQARCLVFDEVDSGIGGATAEIVGQLLHNLAATYQVFCVTHLAQVAAFGTQHFHVAKISGNNITHTQVRFLQESMRVEEIARMMGGLEITEQSLAHAKQMLKIISHKS